jgi:hypothetical protein
LLGGMNTRIGAPTPHNGDGLPEYGGQGRFEHFLHAQAVGLPLPAVVVCSFVSQFKKITHRTKVRVVSLVSTLPTNRVMRKSSERVGASITGHLSDAAESGLKPKS